MSFLFCFPQTHSEVIRHIRNKVHKFSNTFVQLSIIIFSPKMSRKNVHFLHVKLALGNFRRLALSNMFSKRIFAKLDLYYTNFSPKNAKIGQNFIAKMESWTRIQNDFKKHFFQNFTNAYIEAKMWTKSWFFYVVIKFGLQLWHFQAHNWKSYYIVKYIFQKMPKKRSHFGLNISIDDNLETFFSKIFLHSCQNFHFCNNILSDEICII